MPATDDDKFDFKRGLIRYASENNIANKEKVKYTARMRSLYGALCLLIAVLVTLLATRQDISATVMRARGMMYQEQPNGAD
jgi:polyferredoxin